MQHIKMDTIFMNSENSKTSKLQVLILKLTSAPTWNDKFELPDESYSASDIQDYFENI